MTSPRPYGTQAELARRLGVNRSTINRALAAGRLVPAADATAAAHGLLDIEASAARFAATRGHRRPRERGRGRRARHARRFKSLTQHA